MYNRSVSQDSIDEAFTKILIEELADPDRVTNLDETENTRDLSSSTTQWETVANAPVPTAADAGVTPAPPEPPPPGSQPKHWDLRIVYRDGRECTLPLEDQPITIGRDRDNAIVLKCDRVSRHHAMIQNDNRGPRVDDLSSVNGIVVNGIKVPVAYLKAGDVLKIGSVQIHLIPAD